MFCAKHSRKVKLAGKEQLGPAAYFGENEATKRSGTENQKNLLILSILCCRCQLEEIGERAQLSFLSQCQACIQFSVFYYTSNVVWFSTLEIRQNRTSAVNILVGILYFPNT